MVHFEESTKDAVTSGLRKQSQSQSLLNNFIWSLFNVLKVT